MFKLSFSMTLPTKWGRYVIIILIAVILAIAGLDLGALPTLLTL
ncbi:hypothetical protein HNP84_003423 [Thermocatellispora tengchongensis]|uniref:Uncharacterized protein n=1 Tax=Thermocatellispora tengchongensis TaxID=1073253 RepID=A0A840P915_9ACTN|nr:hypothetical protein [Thermocatellispora tengchongensis]MBB5133697.1 hypothetical protein [Thermocatellispora tengchongensis]